MKLDGKTFVVIGGAGLIGSHTIDQLIQHDIKKVIIYDNLTRGSFDNLEVALKDSRVEFYDIGGDIMQTDILNKALHDVDGVFHFAALWLLQCHEFPHSAFDVNVRGTFNVMDACIQNNITRLVYSSSASVYGDAITEPMKEDHPYLNKNFYGATKICAEALLNAYFYRYNLNYVGLRYMNVYGPRQDYKGAYIAVIMKMLDAIDSGKAPTILGDGSEALDFIAVEDCAKANIRAMQSEAVNENYNVGTGIRTSLKELAEMIVELTGCKQEIEYKPSSQATLVKNRIGCPQKAIKELNFKASIDLREGLSRLIEWRKSHIELVKRKQLTQAK